MKILFLGDVVGISGCSKLMNNLMNEIKSKNIDFVIENGESGGSVAGHTSHHRLPYFLRGHSRGELWCVRHSGCWKPRVCRGFDGFKFVVNQQPHGRWRRVDKRRYVKKRHVDGQRQSRGWQLPQRNGGQRAHHIWFRHRV